MSTVDETHKAIKELIPDLEAKILVKPERGHYENNPLIFYGQVLMDHVKYLIDQKAEFKPDTKKIDEAIDMLYRIYRGTRWFSAKYRIADMIGDDNELLEKELLKWSNMLVDLVKKDRIPGAEERIEVVKDAGILYQLSKPSIVTEELKDALQDVYYFDPVAKIQNTAGKFLGYNLARRVFEIRLNPD